MKVECITPDEYQGDLIGDITRRRGHIVNIEAKQGQTIVSAQVPLAEMFGYATAIRSLSKGRASYSMESLTFEQVPNSVLTTILNQAAKKPAVHLNQSFNFFISRRSPKMEAVFFETGECCHAFNCWKLDSINDAIQFLRAACAS